MAGSAIAPFISPSDEFLQYVNASSPQSCMKAVSDLATYVSEEGPFDGVMAFSQGAGLAAVLLVQQMQHDPRLAASSPLFRCAIFFCGAVPEDPRSLQGSHPRRLLRWESDGELIMIPTVHVWGANDMLYPDFGPVLSRLCTASHRDDLVHDGGHEIPGAKNPLVVERVARLIKRCIARAETVIET